MEYVCGVCVLTGVCLCEDSALWGVCAVSGLCLFEGCSLFTMCVMSCVCLCVLSAELSLSVQCVR